MIHQSLAVARHATQAAIALAITLIVLLFAGSARLENAPITGGRIYLTEKDSCDVVERNEGFVSIVCTEVTRVR